MLKKIKSESLNELINHIVPHNIHIEGKDRENMDNFFGQPISELAGLKYIREIANKNKLYQNYIGCGYHPVVTPSVILRNVLENPNWYTSYTPYQV